MTAILRLAEDYFKADTVFLPMDVKQRTNRMGEEYGISGNRECSTATGIPELGGRTCGEKTLRVVTEVLEPSSSCSLLVLTERFSFSFPSTAGFT